MGRQIFANAEFQTVRYVPLMALDAIIFDIDGTLIDSNSLHVEAFRRAFANRGYTILPDRIAVEIGKGGAGC